MSWTAVFPVLSEAQVAEYECHATPDERAEVAAWTEVARVINPKQGRHLIATSLFWKPAQAAESDFPRPTREVLRDAAKLGWVSRHAPWEHYVQPLLDGARALREARPEVVFRVYLAADLEFLVADLMAAGCEVMLMRSASLRHNPGAMWRFLALEEEGRWVTITDADHAPEVLHNVERTEHAMGAGHGLWRAPYMLNGGGPDNDPGFYRPINACQFGAVGGYPVALLMQDLVRPASLSRLRRALARRHSTPLAGLDLSAVDGRGRGGPRPRLAVPAVAPRRNPRHGHAAGSDPL